MPVFDTRQQEEIKTAIAHAEHQTSGEIRVCMEKKCTIDPVNRAAYYFHKLGMEKTQHRNAVLIYLAYEDRKFAIIGDEGIHKHTGPHFWDETKNLMLSYFQKGEIKEALITGIREAGLKIKKFFPHGANGANDRNELSDEIVVID